MCCSSIIYAWWELEYIIILIVILVFCRQLCFTLSMNSQARKYRVFRVAVGNQCIKSSKPHAKQNTKLWKIWLNWIKKILNHNPLLRVCVYFVGIANCYFYSAYIDEYICVSKSKLYLCIEVEIIFVSQSRNSAK